jgi:hypothetical protein
MRVNIYAEELTDDVRVVHTTADTGRTYDGVRIFMHSTDRLHHSEVDDDRSAVTLWGPRAKLRELLEKALHEIGSE